MTDHLEIKLKRAAIALADAADYQTAAANLGISTAELQARIVELETTLCLNLFEPDTSSTVLTSEGRFLIRAFREGLARQG